MSQRLPRKNSLGDLSVLYLSVMGRAVRHHGESESRLFSQYRVSPALLSAPDARISIPRFMRMGEAAIRQTGDPALGLTMGELTRPVDAGVPGCAAMTAPKVADALHCLFRFSELNSRNSRGKPAWYPDRCEAQLYSLWPYNRFNLFVVDSVLAAWTRFIRDISDRQQVLESVRIEYSEPTYAERFEQWFGCPVTFGAASNAITVLPEVCELASLHSQPAMHKEFVQLCEDRLARLQAGWSVSEQVREQLTPRLNGEAPRIDDVASALGKGPWTLRRELAAEGQSFSDLLDEVRRDLAVVYVRETTLKFAEISWLLGFSGPPAFHKAFRRWFGMPAGEFRRTGGE